MGTGVERAPVGDTDGTDADGGRAPCAAAAALRERRKNAAQALEIRRTPQTGPTPLSFSQQRMWFLDQWEPGAPTSNGVRAVRIRGPLDVAALEQAFARVVKRHESLRTVFILVDREPRQVVLSEWSLDLPIVDLTSLRPRERTSELNRRLRELSREPFDLSRDLMIRTTLFSLAENDHVLLVRLHHIAADAFSDPVLFGEVSTIYDAVSAGREPELPELPIQYRDFAAWQLERLQGTVLDELVAYWTDELRGSPQLLPLPTDRPRRAVQRHEGGRHEVLLPAELAERVRAIARAEGCTVYMVLLAAFSTFLYRITGTDDIVVGSPIANRTTLELTPLVGFFCNTMALRTRLGGNPSFREVCGRVRTTALGAYEHQELPFERVVEFLNVPRDPAYNPIFQVNFRAQDGARLRFASPACRRRSCRSTSGSRGSTSRSSCTSSRTASAATSSSTATCSTLRPSSGSQPTSRRCSTRCSRSRRHRCSQSRCRTAVAAAPRRLPGFPRAGRDPPTRPAS